MADTEALRSRRARAHRRGDHHLCRHDRAATRPPPAPNKETPWAPNKETPVCLGCDAPALDDGDLDPRAGLLTLARQLAAAAAGDPANAALARELRETLLAIPAPDDPPDDPLDELRDLASRVS
jgi:hypothetical protein